MSSSSSAVCKVYAGDDKFTIFVQLLLCGIAITSLWIKRLREVPRRKFKTWFLDISKQAFGAAYAHVLNMMIANVIASNVRGNYVLADQCAWYAINYLFDTTFGLVLDILFLRVLDHFANERNWTSLKDSGVYHGREGCVHWTHQITAWILILSIVKVIVVFFMWLLSPILAFWGGVAFKPLERNIRFELLFVMIFFPGFLNVIWFWITDSYLKAKPHNTAAHEDDEDVKEEAAAKKEALITPGDTDEDRSDDTPENAAKDSPYISPSIPSQEISQENQQQQQQSAMV